MEKFLGHVVTTINERNLRREEDMHRNRDETQAVLDDIATIVETRKASAPAASSDPKGTAGHWLESSEFDALPASLQEFTKKAEGHVANGCGDSGSANTQVRRPPLSEKRSQKAAAVAYYY